MKRQNWKHPVFTTPKTTKTDPWTLRRYAASCEAGNRAFARTASYLAADKAFEEARNAFPKDF